MIVVPVQQVRAAAAGISIPTPTLHYRMNEASGNALETIAGLDLTDTNTVTSGAGVVGTAREFTSANSEYFTRADNAAFQLAATQTLALWVYIKASTGNDQYFLVRDVSGGTIDYEMLYRNATQEIWFAYRWAAASFIGFVTLATGIALNTWYCIGVKWDGANIYGSQDGAAWSNLGAAAHAPISGGSATPILGAKRNTGAPGSFFNGRLDIVTFGKGQNWSDADIAAFCNSGAGHEFNGTIWV